MKTLDFLCVMLYNNYSKKNKYSKVCMEVYVMKDNVFNMKTGVYEPLRNKDVIWHLNTAFNCVTIDITDFVNTILLNSEYV